MEEIIYPYFIPCTSQEWEQWNNDATACIMEQSPNGGDNYSNPFTDADGQVYFIVNPEIEQCVPEERRVVYTYEQINWPNENSNNT